MSENDVTKNCTMYHNPKCSKSRKTLELLKEKGIFPRIILYLESPPSRHDLSEIISKLEIEAHEILRKKDEKVKNAALNFSDSDVVLDLLQQEPGVMERPIVVYGGKAVIARPPESVWSIL